MEIDQLYVSPKQAFVKNVELITFLPPPMTKEIPAEVLEGPLTISWMGSAGPGGYYEVAYRRRDQDSWQGVVRTALPTVAIDYAFEPGIMYEFKFVTFTGDGRQTYPEFLSYVLPTGTPAPEVVTINRISPSVAQITLDGRDTDQYIIAYGYITDKVDNFEIVRVIGKTGLLPVEPGRNYRVIVNKISKDEFLPYNKMLDL